MSLSDTQMLVVYVTQDLTAYGLNCAVTLNHYVTLEYLSNCFQRQVRTVLSQQAFQYTIARLLSHVSTYFYHPEVPV